MAVVSFKALKKIWNDSISSLETEFRDNVPSLGSLENVQLELLGRDGKGILVAFNGLSTTVSDENEVNNLRKAIFGWLSSGSLSVKLGRSGAGEFALRLDGTFDSLEEAAVKVFKRKGMKLVPSLKCVGGPKNGQKVSDPSICTKPPEFNRRTAVKKSARKNKGKMKAKRRKTQLTNIVSKRLTKANNRLKKARGGKF